MSYWLVSLIHIMCHLGKITKDGLSLEDWTVWIQPWMLFVVILAVKTLACEELGMPFMFLLIAVMFQSWNVSHHTSRKTCCPANFPLYVLLTLTGIHSKSCIWLYCFVVFWKRYVGVSWYMKPYFMLHWRILILEKSVWK